MSMLVRSTQSEIHPVTNHSQLLSAITYHHWDRVIEYLAEQPGDIEKLFPVEYYSTLTHVGRSHHPKADEVYAALLASSKHMRNLTPEGYDQQICSLSKAGDKETARINMWLSCQHASSIPGYRLLGIYHQFKKEGKDVVWVKKLMVNDPVVQKMVQEEEAREEAKEQDSDEDNSSCFRWTRV